MEEQISYEILREAVANRAAAIRSQSRLQPAGGAGDKVFPPTYAGAVYAVEKRRVRVSQDGRESFETVPCVLLDSVQSQANRMETALLEAVDDGRISIPVVTVDFEATPSGDERDQELSLPDPVGRVTSLELPHRIADAILRESVDNSGVPFRETEIGQALNEASAGNATPIYGVCPTALVFGMWDSTGPKGGLGVKFERAMTSEIVGVRAAFGVRTQSRVDPIIRVNPKGEKLSDRNLGMVTPDVSRYEKKSITDHNAQTLDPMRSDGEYIRAGRVRPGGVTIDYAEQMTVISLAAIQRLRFPVRGTQWHPGQEQRSRDIAARTVLVALALVGAELASEAGMDLRSRCLLWPEHQRVWEILATPGEKPVSYTAGAQRAGEVLSQAVGAARAAGVEWLTEGLTFFPSRDLLKTVQKSQLAAIKDTSAGSGS